MRILEFGDFRNVVQLNCGQTMTEHQNILRILTTSGSFSQSPSVRPRSVSPSSSTVEPVLCAVWQQQRDRLGAHPGQLGAVAGGPFGRLRQDGRVVGARALGLGGNSIDLKNDPKNGTKMAPKGFLKRTYV